MEWNPANLDDIITDTTNICFTEITLIITFCRKLLNLDWKFVHFFKSVINWVLVLQRNHCNSISSLYCNIFRTNRVMPVVSSPSHKTHIPTKTCLVLSWMLVNYVASPPIFGEVIFPFCSISHSTKFFCTNQQIT